MLAVLTVSNAVKTVKAPAIKAVTIATIKNSLQSLVCLSIQGLIFMFLLKNHLIYFIINKDNYFFGSGGYYV